MDESRASVSGSGGFAARGIGGRVSSWKGGDAGWQMKTMFAPSAPAMQAALSADDSKAWALVPNEIEIWRLPAASAEQWARIGAFGGDALSLPSQIAVNEASDTMLVNDPALYGIKTFRLGCCC